MEGISVEPRIAHVWGCAVLLQSYSLLTAVLVSFMTVHLELQGYIIYIGMIRLASMGHT